MDGIDLLRAVVRWVHVVAAVVWVGGSLFYLLVLRPAMSGSNGGDTRERFEMTINRGFRDVVDVAIIALIVTGVVITFDRLSSAPITSAYYAVLGLKIAAAVSMFLLARDLGTRLGRWGRPRRRAAAGAVAEPSLADDPKRRSRWGMLFSPSRLIVALGLVAFFLSALMVHIYESGIADI